MRRLTYVANAPRASANANRSASEQVSFGRVECHGPLLDVLADVLCRRPTLGFRLSHDYNLSFIEWYTLLTMKAATNAMTKVFTDSSALLS